MVTVDWFSVKITIEMIGKLMQSNLTEESRIKLKIEICYFLV